MKTFQAKIDRKFLLFNFVNHFPLTNIVLTTIYSNFSGHRFINILSDISKLKAHYLITWNYVMLWNFVELALQYLVLNSLLTFSLRLLRSIICINFTKRFIAEAEYISNLFW